MVLSSQEVVLELRVTCGKVLSPQQVVSELRVRQGVQGHLCNWSEEKVSLKAHTNDLGKRPNKGALSMVLNQGKA